MHAFGEPRDRHADVGRHRARAGADLQAGEVRVVPRLPQLGALLRLGGPDEVLAAVLLGDGLHRLCLLDHRAVGAVELEEHGGSDAVIGLLVLVDRGDSLVADDVAARDRDAGLDGLDHRVGAAVDRIEGAHRGRHRLLHRVQAHRDFGDDAERAFRADEQARQVIAGSGFLRAARGVDDAPVGQHHFQRQHVLAHRAVAHRVGSGGARRRHAAQGGVGARVYREEQAGVLDVFVELLARDAGLHHRVEVLLVHREHLVHLRQVDRDAAFHREDVPLERGTDAERNHRHAMALANVHYVAHFLGCLYKHDCIGQRVREVGLVLAVVLAHCGRGRDAIAEQRLQLRHHRLVEFARLVHSAILV